MCIVWEGGGGRENINTYQGLILKVEYFKTSEYTWTHNFINTNHTFLIDNIYNI